MDAANMTSPQELRSPYNAKLAASAAHVANAPNDSNVQAFAWPTSLDSTFDEGTGTGTTSSNTHSGESPSRHASDDYSMDDDESQSLEVALHPTSSSSSSRPVSSTRSLASASPLSHHRSESTASNSTGGGGGGATSLPSKLDSLMPFGTGDSKRHTMASVNTTLSAPELHSPPESDDDSFPYDATSTSGGSSLRAPRPASTGARRSQRFNSTGSSSATSSSKHHHHAGAPSSSSSRRETTPVWKTRHKCTPDQQRQLLAFFDANRNPKGKVRQELADQLGMPERSVQIWFQNRRARVRKLCKSYGIDEDSPRAALLILQRRGVAPAAAAPVSVKKKSSNGSTVAKKKSITVSIKHKQHHHHQSRSSSQHSPSSTHLDDVAAVLATHSNQPSPLSQVASRRAVDEDYDKCSSPGSEDDEEQENAEEELRRRRSLWEACQDIVGEPRAKLKANPDEARTSSEQQAQQQQQQPQSPVSKPSRLSTGSSSKAERSSSSRSGGEVARQSSKSKLSADGTLSVTQLPAFSLCIATWRRVSPLTCFFSRRLHRLSWTLKADSVGFRIDLPYTSIKSLAFSGPVRPSMAELAEGISEPLGLLRVDLEKQPQFYMETFRSADPVDEADALQNRWRQTEDFTEGNQGTHCLTHVLSGPFEPLRAAVEALRASDANIGDRLVMYESMPAAGSTGGSVEMGVDAAGASNSAAVPMAAFDDAAAASTSSTAAAASTDLGGPPPLLRQQDWQHHPHQPSFIGPVASYGGEVAGQFGYSTTGSTGGSGSHHREIHSSPLTASYELSYQHPHQHHQQHHHHQQQHQHQQQHPHIMPYSHYATARPGTSDSAVSLIGGDDTFSSVRAQLGHHSAGSTLGFSPGPRYQQAQQQGQQQQQYHAAGPHSVDLHSYGSAHDLHAQQQQQHQLQQQQQQHHPPSAPPTLASLWSTDEGSAPGAAAGSHVVPLTVSGDMLSASSHHHHGFASGPGSGGHSPLSISGNSNSNSNSRRPSAPTLLTGGHALGGTGTGSLETSPGPTSASSLNAALAFSQEPSRRASATSSGSGGGGVWDRPPPMTLLAQRQAALQAAAQAQVHAQQQQQHQTEQDSVMLHSPQ